MFWVLIVSAHQNHLQDLLQTQTAGPHPWSRIHRYWNEAQNCTLPSPQVMQVLLVPEPLL